MRVDVIPVKDLTEGMKRDWLRMQASNPGLMSPFFHPELFISAGKFFPGIYVALLYKENKLEGFLPYLKDPKTLKAHHIEFCDFEAIICEPDQYWDIDIVLRKMGLPAWEFNALVNYKNITSKSADIKVRDSFRIDLSCGLEEYWSFIKAKKVKFKSLLVDRRLLETKVGPLRFVGDCKDIKVLHQLLQWKISHHNRDLQWAKLAEGLLEHFYYLNDPLIQGVMSALYAGDVLLAVNFVLRQQGKLGGVITTFNPEYTKYSTGIILLHELLNEHKTLEFDVLDMGPVANRYKQDYSNSSLSTLCGTFRIETLKEKIKSIDWLYQGLLPIVKLKKKTLK